MKNLEIISLDQCLYIYAGADQKPWDQELAKWIGDKLGWALKKAFLRYLDYLAEEYFPQDYPPMSY